MILLDLIGDLPFELNIFSYPDDPRWYYPVVAMASITAYTVYRYRLSDEAGIVMKKEIPPRTIDQVLDMDMLYYRYLPTEEKKAFVRRVNRLMRRKRFIYRVKGGKPVTTEMKILLAGSAVQLTFGLGDITLEHFSKILIYPTEYYSRITRKYHRGEVNAGGIIVLSWPYFVDGYKDHSDGRNLGLHEMAHALRLENRIHNGEFDFIPKPLIEAFDKQARAEMDISRTTGSSFFRNYGMTNMHEFFSVACENFFERPHGFKAYNPDLYQALSDLLRQDPVQWLPVGLEKRNPLSGDDRG